MTVLEYVDDIPVAKMLDALSDGQWHAYSKINRKSLKHFGSEESLRKTLDSLSKEGVLLAGNNESYRFRLPYLEMWRDERGHNSSGQSRLAAPRYFGGVLEDDGWLLAPLRTFDLVHFRAVGAVTPEVIQERIGLLGVASQDEDGLLRISTMNGDLVYKIIKQWAEEEPSLEICGVRSDSPVRRRELEDLPKRYVEDLCVFYGSFAHTLLRKHMSSVYKHINERDDVQQRIYMWIIDAIQRYDDTTSIPFAAYLASMLRRWVFDLNRKSYGRAAADNELKFARAVNAFEAEHGRRPTTPELADILGEDIATTREKSASIALVNNLRTVTTLDTEEFDIPVRASDDQAADLDEEVNQTLLSAALTTAAFAPQTPNLLGWVSMYEQTWGKGQPSAKSLGTDTKTLNRAQTAIRDDLQKRLADFHN